MTRFILSREAAADIEAIARYTHQSWGATQAVDYIDDLMAACSRIAELPGIGVLVEGYGQDVRRYRSGHHILHYRVRAGTVEIIAFRHERTRQA